jgi:D-galactarolactone cycloisomerase
MIRITGVKVHTLTGRLRQRFGWSLSWTETRTATLVEVTTDAGLTGWGEGGYGGERLRRNPELVIGRSPFEVEGIFEDLRSPAQAQQRMGPPTSAGLDVALWDIMGQALDKPVCRILGRQYRQRVQPYCTALYRKDWPDLAAGLAAEARAWKAKGFQVLKMKIGYGPGLDVEIVRAVRQAIGEDVGLAVDANCAYDDGAAVALGRRLEEFNLLWWEEPIWADDLAGYARLRKALKIPLASGETMSPDWLIKNYIQPRLVDIVQPDLDIVGLTGGRNLSHFCRLNQVRLIPHNWGTPIGTAATLHWMSCLPPMPGPAATPAGAFELDQTENPLRAAVVRQTFDIDPVDGCIQVPTRPGLGIDVVREAVQEYRTELLTIS